MRSASIDRPLHEDRQELYEGFIAQSRRRLRNVVSVTPSVGLHLVVPTRGFQRLDAF
jgi:hypothetical protein